jgi:hypothetical protein
MSVDYIYNSNDQLGFTQDELVNLLQLDPDDFSYGNYATRTLLITAYYYYMMSGIYFDIFDLYPDEMKSFRKDFDIYLSFVNNTAKDLCVIARRNLEVSSIDKKDLDSVNQLHSVLVDNWEGFLAWKRAANDYSHEVGVARKKEIKELGVPKCKEYPTDNPRYVIVKCTDLP